MRVYTNIQELNLPSRFEEKLLSDIDYIHSYNLKDLEEIILFGSCARNEIRLTSDIDLLIITTTQLDRLTRGDLASTLEEGIDAVQTDAVFYSREQFETSSRLFTTQIKNEGIILYKSTNQKRMDLYEK